jgi:crossover junction endodeoxyribonuclease RusA
MSTIKNPGIKTYQPLLQFWIEGEPVPKGRPRLGANGNVRTPQQTKQGEQWVQTCLLGATVGRMIDPTGEFEVILEYTTASHAKDLDNLIKLDLDALNGYVWADDRQVTHIDARITRTTKEPPGTLITINHLTN